MKKTVRTQKKTTSTEKVILKSFVKNGVPVDIILDKSKNAPLFKLELKPGYKIIKEEVNK